MTSDVLMSVLRDLVRETVREVLAEERTAASGGAELLTVEECAAIAKVRPATIRTWVKLGQLRACHVGRRLRVTRKDLDGSLTPGVRAIDKGASPEERARRAAARALGID